MKEYWDTCKKGMMEKLAVVEHVWENYHAINWEDKSVQGQETRRLLLKEVLKVQVTPAEEHFNRVLRLLDCTDVETGRERQRWLDVFTLSSLLWLKLSAEMLAEVHFQSWVGFGEEYFLFMQELTEQQTIQSNDVIQRLAFPVLSAQTHAIILLLHISTRLKMYREEPLTQASVQAPSPC